MTGFDGAVPDAADLDGGPDAGPPCVEGATLGEACASDAQCDDACFCNGRELCVEGVCVGAASPPCVDAVDCTLDGCIEDERRCDFVPNHAVCSDGDACNGEEQCDPLVGGCRPSSPLYCNDEDACTVDTCETATGCVFTPRDLDGDGFVDARCGGEDCDDDPRTGANVHPGATEICDNRRDDNCNGLRDYFDPTCVPTNDDCALAQWLPGPGTYSGATRDLRATTTLGCGPADGPDAYFRFALDAPRDVWVTAAGTGSLAVGLRRGAECDAGGARVCGDGSPATILRRSLEAGEHVIVVKSGAPIVFDLTLRFEPPTEVPRVDVCDDETVDVSAGGTFTGLFVETSDLYTLACQASAPRRDAAYRLTLTEPQDVVLSLTTTGPGTPSSHLALVRDCADPSTTLRCQNSANPARVVHRALEPGTYYVLLESTSTSAGGWSLDVSLSDPEARPPGDSCATAVDITAGSGAAELATAERSLGSSCGSTSTFARDLVFTFTLSTLRDVELRTEGAGFHAVSLMTECGQVPSELRCRQGSSPMIQSWRSLPAGTYFAVVTTTSTTGTVSASLSTSDPTPIPPNDRCEGAIDVSMGAARTDTLSGFEDDVQACGGAHPDAFYVMRFAEPTEVLISVRPTVGAYTHNLSLREGCGALTSLVCGSGNPAVINRVLDPGEYVLVVEAPAASAGDFELRVVTF